jgi:hypothetical protein
MTLARIATPLLACAALTAAAAGQSADPIYDAPYVPSPRSIVAEMLELAEVGAEDHLIDLGSGDGRIVLTAAKVFGASGLGVEIREDLVELSRRAAMLHGVADRVRFVRQDLFETDLSEATVVTLYLLPETVNRLRGKLLWELAPGTRILSHDYPIDDWPAERVVHLEHQDKVEVTGVARTNLYLYRVPADVDGRWRATVPAGVSTGPLDLEFAQHLTLVRGRARVGEQLLPLVDVELAGLDIAFSLPGRVARFSGRIDNGVMAGTVEADGVRGRWRAERGKVDPR